MRTKARVEDQITSFSKFPQQIDKTRSHAAVAVAEETKRFAMALALERARLAAKYGDDSSQVVVIDSRGLAQQDLIAELDLDVERTAMEIPKADERSFVLAGRVLDSSAKPVPRVTVRATAADGTTLTSVSTGARGEFTLKTPAGTSFTVEVIRSKETVLKRSYKEAFTAPGELTYEEFFLPARTKPSK